ncbi:hypothetical protein [Pseudarthrobacter cellobiosi]|uniref:hypothetical protein n=1 Tax=Pseudarthrobacter cellobiosi TaxID=2953654 RepID=UPI00208F6BF1|nr:hypothetical protein [Pseudarthrobacter sp. HLT1-5]MCO4255925.1 hypothetical protein [Pseudarthrobacter sp. HLT1-5]
MQRIIADLLVRDPADKETQLTFALETAIQEAKVNKACGVLVTRHHYTQFTVALSPTVPYGQTYELDLSPNTGGEEKFQVPPSHS